jgi:hypothetical protein
MALADVETVITSQLINIEWKYGKDWIVEPVVKEPTVAYRRLLGLCTPFSNSSTLIFSPSATFINVSRRGQRLPVSRNPMPVRLSPER